MVKEQEGIKGLGACMSKNGGEREGERAWLEWVEKEKRK